MSDCARWSIQLTYFRGVWCRQYASQESIATQNRPIFLFGIFKNILVKYDGMKCFFLYEIVQLKNIIFITCFYLESKLWLSHHQYYQKNLDDTNLMTPKKIINSNTSGPHLTSKTSESPLFLNGMYNLLESLFMHYLVLLDLFYWDFLILLVVS